MISDTLLEFNSQWGAYTDPGIGNQPNEASVTPATQADPYLTVYIQGGSYANMMGAVHRPILFGNYTFSFEIIPDPNNTSAIQALEFEACYCDQNSVYYNNSMQLCYVNPKGMIQAYLNPNDVWANTGIVVPLFTPGEPTSVAVNYSVDTNKRVMSTLSVTINGKTYPLPSEFQNIPGAVRQGWAPAAYVQFQLDLASKGGSITNKYNNISLLWP